MIAQRLDAPADSVGSEQQTSDEEADRSKLSVFRMFLLCFHQGPTASRQGRWSGDIRKDGRQRVLLPLGSLHSLHPPISSTSCLRVFVVSVAGRAGAGASLVFLVGTCRPPARRHSRWMTYVSVLPRPVTAGAPAKLSGSETTVSWKQQRSAGYKLHITTPSPTINRSKEERTNDSKVVVRRQE